MKNNSVLCVSVNMQYGELDGTLTINVSWHCWLLKILFSAQFWDACQQAFEIQWEKSHLDRTWPLICPLNYPRQAENVYFPIICPVFKNLGVIQMMTGPTSKAAKPEPYQLGVLGPHQTSLSPFCVRWGNRQVRNKGYFFAQGPNNAFISYACI